MFDQNRLQEALKVFRDYSKTPRFEEETKERVERKRDFRDLYDLVLRKFDESIFAEIVKRLWASQIWANKEYLVSQILKSNGAEKIEKALRNLLTGETSPGSRYEKFMGEIKYMGPAMVTEILCYADPVNGGVWNDKARKALAWLGVSEVPVGDYRISASDYDNFTKVLKALAEYLKKEGYEKADLLTVDYFLWEIWDKLAKGEKSLPKSTTKKLKVSSKHDEIRDKISQIGSGLGFETETEKPVAVGTRVDVVWTASIANLGTVSYAFEVQDRGSIDGLIVNLQRAQNNSTVQKLIVVSDSSQIEKIKKEAGTMPESFRKALAFWDIEDIDVTYESLGRVTESIAKLNLAGS